MKNRGLGRGLDALLSNDGDNVSSKIEPTNVMPLSQLTPGKFQPRKNFNQDSLKELAESIKAQGIIQPILVRMTSNDQYEIIAGERRWQAAKIARLTEALTQAVTSLARAFGAVRIAKLINANMTIAPMDVLDLSPFVPVSLL